MTYLPLCSFMYFCRYTAGIQSHFNDSSHCFLNSPGDSCQGCFIEGFLGHWTLTPLIPFIQLTILMLFTHSQDSFLLSLKLCLNSFLQHLFLLNIGTRVIKASLLKCVFVLQTKVLCQGQVLLTPESSLWSLS